MHLHSIDTLSAHPGTIVVPNAACARLLRTELDQCMRLDGRLAWSAPDVAAARAWMERAFDESMLRSGEDPVFVLSREQELAVWELVIASASGQVPGTAEEAARLAQHAWGLMHDWEFSYDEVFAGPLTEDVAVFRRWSAAYSERCTTLGAIEQARIAAQTSVPAPGALAHGFVDPVPALARAFSNAGVAEPSAPAEPDGAAGPVCRVYPDQETELHAAAEWAAMLSVDDPRARIVVAVNGLGGTQDLVRRCVEDVFPEAADCAARDRVTFGIDPLLHRDPVVRAALAILDFRPVMGWDAVSTLLTSPHVRGAIPERGARAAFDAELRALLRYEIPAPFVGNLLASTRTPCPEFAAMFRTLHGIVEAAPRRQRLAAWLDHFDACLRAAGWPGDLPADPAILRHWNDACDRLNRLDAVLAPLSRSEALSRLRRLVNDTPLRLPATDPRVFVVTPEQAAVLHPTALWIAGCTSDAFANVSGASPFLPHRLQREKGVPGAYANRDLFRARQLLAALTRGDVPSVASCASAEGDIRLTPSPLLPGMKRAERIEQARYLPPSWRGARDGARFSTLVDEAGPALAARARVRGGVARFGEQAACPFRSFARFRLDARAPEEPRPGIDPRHKGTVVHRALAMLWMQLGGQAELADLRATERERLLQEAISKSFTPLPFETPLERALHFVERERLATLLDQWLEFELTREPFTVVAAEREDRVVFEGLEIRVRVDRVDRIADGELVIDYKTGQCREADWAPPRMDQPQLPFYALGSPSARVGAVAFAKVHAGAPDWVQAPAPGDDEATWQARRDEWRADLATLAAGIRSGDARVDPKRGPQTCRHCDQHLFCRIAELTHGRGADGDPDD